MGDADGSWTSTVLPGRVPGWDRGPRGNRRGFEPQPASTSRDFARSPVVLCCHMGLAQQPCPPHGVWGGQVVRGLGA